MVACTLLILTEERILLTVFGFVYKYTRSYMTLGRCPLSIFCSRGTLSNPFSQPTLSLSPLTKRTMHPPAAHLARVARRGSDGVA